MTREEPFQLGEGRKFGVPFMHQTGSFSYLAQDGVQILELPYQGGDLAMVLLLPHSAEGLAELESGLSVSRLAGWIARLRHQKVDVALPRFRMTAELELKQALSELGMPLAFDEARADFSGMLEEDEELSVSDVVHKAFVDVNEEGTESAAATGTTLKPRGLAAAPPLFRADHAFLFLIRDRRSDQLLVLGRLADPRGGPGETTPEGKDGRSAVR